MSVNEGRAKDRLLNIYFEYTETLDELVPRTIIDQLINDIRDAFIGQTCDPCVNFVGGACNQARPIQNADCEFRKIAIEWLVNYDDTVIIDP